jgi:hypothetical protein
LPKAVSPVADARGPCSPGIEEGDLPLSDNAFAPIVTRPAIRRRGPAAQLAILTACLLVIAGVAGAVYFAATSVGTESAEENAKKTSDKGVAPAAQKKDIEEDPSKNGSIKGAGLKKGELQFPRRALFICISNYLYANPVSYGTKSRTVHSVFERLCETLHIPENQRLELSDGAPVDAYPPLKPVIENTVTEFLDSCRAQDRIILAFIGHAVEIDGQPYLVPLEGQLGVKETLIPLKWVYSQLSKCKARQKVFIVDVCRYDPSRGLERPAGGPMGEKLDAALKNPPRGVQVWSACVAGQYSYEGYVLLRPGEVAHAGFFLDELFEAVGPNQKKKVHLGIAKPEDPLPLDVLAQGKDKGAGVARGTESEANEVYKEKQTPRLVGQETGTVPYDPEEPLPAKLVIKVPPPPDGAEPADKKLVAEITRQLEAIPPIKMLKEGGRSLNADSLPAFSAKVMEQYPDDPNSPLRPAVEKAIQVIAKQSELVKEEFRGQADNPAIKKRILEDQKPVAKVLFELNEAREELEKSGEKRSQESSKRWQANYDYVHARLLEKIAYVHEYDYMFGQIRKDQLPPRDPNVHSGWRLASQVKVQSGGETRKIAAEAKKILDRLTKDHKGTPWEILAKREALTALGLEWKPTR